MIAMARVFCADSVDGEGDPVLGAGLPAPLPHHAQRDLAGGLPHRYTLGRHQVPQQHGRVQVGGRCWVRASLGLEPTG